MINKATINEDYLRQITNAMIDETVEYIDREKMQRNTVISCILPLYNRVNGNDVIGIAKYLMNNFLQARDIEIVSLYATSISPFETQNKSVLP